MYKIKQNLKFFKTIFICTLLFFVVFNITKNGGNLKRIKTGIFDNINSEIVYNSGNDIGTIFYSKVKDNNINTIIFNTSHIIPFLFLAILFLFVCIFKFIYKKKKHYIDKYTLKIFNKKKAYWFLYYKY